MKKLQQKHPYTWILGIDISKETIDACLKRPTSEQSFHKKFLNNQPGFNRLKAWCKKMECSFKANTICCMEHTGLYTRPLVNFLVSQQVDVWLENSFQIKRSQGLIRGKSDKVDAQRIVCYADMHIQKAKLLDTSILSFEKIKDLQANRRRLVKAIQSLKTSAQELKKFDNHSGNLIDKINSEAFQGLQSSLDQVDEQILECINKDSELKEKYNLAISVKGVGKVLATSLIVYTHGFNRLLDSRKLACYCGVAPFVYESGTSIRGRTRVSKFANNELKKNLHMAALGCIQYNAELKDYYNRKITEGKNKMSIINALRNKLLHQIVAVIKRGTPYEVKSI